MKCTQTGAPDSNHYFTDSRYKEALVTGESKVITLASLKFWLNVKMRSILCMFLFPLGFVCMNFFTFAVAIWPVTDQAVENTKWPAVSYSP